MRWPIWLPRHIPPGVQGKLAGFGIVVVVIVVLLVLGR